jgi:hypothetical protein
VTAGAPACMTRGTISTIRIGPTSSLGVLEWRDRAAHCGL